MEYMKFFDCIVVRHVYRKVNEVAHRLTTFNKRSAINDFQLTETPSIIKNVQLLLTCYDDFLLYIPLKICYQLIKFFISKKRLEAKIDGCYLHGEINFFCRMTRLGFIS